MRRSFVPMAAVPLLARTTLLGACVEALQIPVFMGWMQTLVS